MTTKKALKELVTSKASRYPWWSDEAKQKAMSDAIDTTFAGLGNVVAVDGPIWIESWKELGFKGKPTYKAIRALPLE